MRAVRHLHGAKVMNDSKRSKSRRWLVAPALILVVVAAAACGGGSPSGVAAGTSPGAQQVRTLLTQGLAAQNAGNLGTATADYNQILAQQPANQYALYDLGLVEQEQNDTVDAETHYRAALAVNPNFAPALFNLAIVVTPSSPTEAQALYGQVIALQPNDAAAHLNLGFVLQGLGKKATALAEFRKAVAIDPSLAKRLGNTLSGTSGTVSGTSGAATTSGAS